MAVGYGGRKLSFYLLPSSDDEEHNLSRSVSDRIANDILNSPDRGKKPARRKRRNRGSKKKIKAVTNSIAQNLISEQLICEDVDDLIPSAHHNGSSMEQLDSPVSQNGAIVKDFSRFYQNCSSPADLTQNLISEQLICEDVDDLSPSAHQNGSSMEQLDSPVAQNGAIVKDFSRFYQNCSSPADLSRENSCGKIVLESPVSGNQGDVENFHQCLERRGPTVELARENGSEVTRSDSLISENMPYAGGVNSLLGNIGTPVELRQRSVNGVSWKDGMEEEAISRPPSSSVKWKSDAERPVNRLETAVSLDWNRLMAENSNDLSYGEKLPLRYFLGEINAGNALRRTISIGNERNRQRVYNTMFHVPWRCELLIDVGFFVCLDSFLSLLTIMPARILMTIWRFLTIRQFRRPSAAELSDFGCFVVLAGGVACLQGTDISLIYHIIRGQGTVKLYVVYNVLEIFDKLCQSFGEDVVQVLFNSAEGVANCLPEDMTFQLMRFLVDQLIAVLAFIVHSFILLAQAITLSTAIVAHNNALLALLVSNNFAEVKSNVFKRLSKDNLHALAYHDTVERFHILAFLLFVLAQNILEADGPWFGSFVTNALLIYVCEILIDIVKHSFLAKFNEIKPKAYSEFLEALCKQTLNMEPETGQKNLTFVPLAPACVVIRVVTPLYAAHLPYGPLAWRIFWIFLLSAMTYFMLAILKILVGMGLRLHATWYIKRCERKKQHFD